MKLRKNKNISCAQFEMSVFGRKKTFMIKILIGPSKYKKILKFKKILGTSKVKSNFSTYFSIESSNPKRNFCNYKPCLHFRKHI